MLASEVDWYDVQSVSRFVLWCIENDCMQHFYRTYQWRKVRDAVMALDHDECQLCRAEGRYARAKVAHHVNPLKLRPDLALSIWCTDTQGRRSRNIIAVCNPCHERIENRIEKLHAANRKAPLTQERW